MERLIFNEAVVLTGTLCVIEPVVEDVIQPCYCRCKDKHATDLKNLDLPVEVITYTLSEEKLRIFFAWTDGNGFWMRSIKESCDQQFILLKNVM